MSSETVTAVALRPLSDTSTAQDPLLVPISGDQLVIEIVDDGAIQLAASDVLGAGPHGCSIGAELKLLNLLDQN